MPDDRRSPLSLAMAASLLVLNACQGSLQNTSPLMPRSGMSGPTSNSAPAAKRLKKTTGGYTLTDLGALPGDTGSEVGDGTQAYANPLNNAGQAAGASFGADTATLFSNGKAININTLNSSISLGNAINASGEVAGQEINAACDCYHAFLYSNGSMQDINNNSVFPGGSIAYGINKTGQIVGQASTNSSTHAFLYSNGQMTDINPFPGYESRADSINDSGQIIGSSSNNNSGTWLYSNGTVTTLSQTNSGIFINSNGQIVGQNTSNHGALYSKGTWTDLGGYPGALGTAALGINSSGQIVGFAAFAGHGYHPRIPPHWIAVIFTSSGAVDLNTLIPQNSGFTLNFGVGINDSGQIAVDATNSSKQKRAVLLTPN